jgi:uncharacterized membrane protein
VTFAIPAATLWLAAGESIYFVKEQLGHADTQTAINIFKSAAFRYKVGTFLPLGAGTIRTYVRYAGWDDRPGA